MPGTLPTDKVSEMLPDPLKKLPKLQRLGEPKDYHKDDWDGRNYG